MKKITNALFNLFYILYGVFLYSLILPLTFGAIIGLIVPIINWFQDLPRIVMIILSIAIGIGIRMIHIKTTNLKMLFNIDYSTHK